MGCYKPMIRRENLGKWKKAADGHLYHPANIFSSDKLELYDKKDWGNYKYEFIPCGKCIGCRLDYSRNWANRGYLESLLWEQNWFVTLTYDDKYLPYQDEWTTTEGITYTDQDLEELEWKGTLEPNDFTQFMKNLRQIMKREYGVDGIRFIGCGEYGTEERRPHYHLILFNFNIPVDQLYEPHLKDGDYSYKCKLIERAWSERKGKACECMGICDVTPATWNTIAYVARYITKKINGKESEDFYAMQGELKEFFRCSTGIGKGYYDLHKEDIYKYDQILIKNKKGSHWVKPPKYFDDLYEQEEPEKMKQIKQNRKKLQLQQLINKSKLTSLTRWEQLQLEQDLKEKDAQMLSHRDVIERSKK